MNSLSTNQKANAKINLYLHVTGKRNDGYHTLDSLVVFADIGDNISVSSNNEENKITLSITGPFAKEIPSGEDNLVVGAAKFLQQRYSITAGANISLEKNLPPASGVGGGSADAAATIRALANLWKIDLNQENESEFNKVLAHDLGADVPVCLKNKNVFMGGIGEIFTPAPALPPFWMVLANPGRKVSTPDVFSGRKGAFSKSAIFNERPAGLNEFVEIIATQNNDLFASAVELAPEIKDVISALEKLDGALLTRMSGSGATCFAIFASADAAHAGARQIADKYPGWWAQSAQMASP
ncbi:MAG: 4-(cytidine 5'-diphospho)-2-C-methyl-D-erythritol kinase [Rhodospirillaceae bacterium]|nr:4-(cytidine 5'-diphospho)-2-C-methyl-D-erythritol kinase [Rhodospirillaceae bacterium]